MASNVLGATIRTSPPSSANELLGYFSFGLLVFIATLTIAALPHS